MKTSHKFFIILFLIFSINKMFISESSAQEFSEWETKTPLTDSISDNTNSYLLYWHSDNFGDMMNMVWEKATDQNSAAIFYRNLLGGDETVEVVSSPGVHYTHPVILKLAHADTLFYVFYQSDQYGDRDIFYSIFTDDGQFSEPIPFPFNQNELDEEYFTVGNDGYWDQSRDSKYILNVIGWISDGLLMTSNLMKNGEVYSFSQPDTLDTGTCSDPVIVNDQSIFYIKADDAGRFIYTVNKQYPTYEWGEPSLYFNQGNCYNLAEDNVEPRFITWSSDSNSVYRNYLADSYWPYDGYAIGPASDIPLDPAVCTIMISVEPQQYEFYEFYMAFPYLDNGFNEIFMNQGYNWGDPDPEFLDFSQSVTENLNPEYYTGEQYPWNGSCFYVYLVWEQLRNDHWQIFSSKTLMCVGSIEENVKNSMDCQVYPNPFKDEINLTYKLSSDDFVKIEVFDLYGRKIKELYSGHQEAGEQNVTWHGNDGRGSGVEVGIYMIRISAGLLNTSQRVIKIE